jgi:hypothetical protein
VNATYDDKVPRNERVEETGEEGEWDDGVDARVGRVERQQFDELSAPACRRCDTSVDVGWFAICTVVWRASADAIKTGVIVDILKGYEQNLWRIYIGIFWTARNKILFS